MIFNGFLFDIDYITKNEKAIIRLWCLDKDGKFFVTQDRNFIPYFYALPNGTNKGAENLALAIQKSDIGLRDVEIVEKKNLGISSMVFKILVNHPKDVPKLRKEVKSLGFETREDDVLFSIRYLIDKGICPFDWVEIDGDEVRLDNLRVVNAKSVKFKHIDEYPKLRIIAFNCEMLNPREMPFLENEPIKSISLATNDGKIEQIKMEGNDEANVIKRFIEFIRCFDPHIILGFNCDSREWPYILKRSEKLEIAMELGRDKSTIKQGRGGVGQSFKIAGRANIDLYRIASRDLGSVKVKTLKNVAEYLGIFEKSEVLSMLLIAEKLLPLQYELAKMVKYPLEDTSRMGRGRMVEALLSAEAFRLNELVPLRNWAEESYEGGFVLEPKDGLHENVISLDFSSMYPSIMIAYNISPDTIAHGEGDFYLAPEVGHKFLREPDGFFKKIIKDLVKRRDELKLEIKRAENEKRMILDIKQQSLKILTNAFYGYMGWGLARWYKRECAEATTAWGRYFIKNAINKAESFGLEVIYGDTDSLFVKSKEGRGVLLECVKKLSTALSKEIPIELEVEDFYDVIFFTEKKKRYAGLTSEGNIIVRGLEVRRGDWCELSKEIQLKIIELILKDRDTKSAVKLVRDTIRKLKGKNIPLDKLIIYKTLTKSIESYKVRQAHVIAAKRARSHNIIYDVGSKVPYVILKGSASISDRAYPAELFSENLEIDIDYYINQQIIPVSSRILKYFGYTATDLLGSGQETLDEWF